jgi:hypothetical protein
MLVALPCYVALSRMFVTILCGWAMFADVLHGFDNIFMTVFFAIFITSRWQHYHACDIIWYHFSTNHMLIHQLRFYYLSLYRA